MHLCAPHAHHFIYAVCTDGSKTAAHPQKACDKYHLCLCSDEASEYFRFLRCNFGLIYLNSPSFAVD